MKKLLKWIVASWGFELVKLDPKKTQDGLPVDFTDAEKTLVASVKPYTMTSPERIVSVAKAVEYIVQSKIVGSVVECGVWKGGSTMAALLTLIEQKDTLRPVFLYDTFEGMSAPTAQDQSFQGKEATELLDDQDRLNSHSVWCYSTLEEVKANIRSTHYPPDRIHYIQGKVEDTIPQSLPGPIALLRLDTDWYESTKHELEHLYPLLSPGGVIIIDDYGHWKGARKAVDEYFAHHHISLLLNRIDYTGRMAVKR